MVDQVRRATAKADDSDFEIGAAVDRPGTHRAKPPGGTDTIADHSLGLEVKIGKEDGVISPSGFAADRTGSVDLVGGAGGFKTARAVVTALQSDGNGRTLLPLGVSGQIDFVGVPVGTLKADKGGAGQQPRPNANINSRDSIGCRNSNGEDMSGSPATPRAVRPAVSPSSGAVDSLVHSTNRFSAPSHCVAR